MRTRTIWVTFFFIASFSRPAQAQEKVSIQLISKSDQLIWNTFLDKTSVDDLYVDVVTTAREPFKELAFSVIQENVKYWKDPVVQFAMVSIIKNAPEQYKTRAWKMLSGIEEIDFGILDSILSSNKTSVEYKIKAAEWLLKSTDKSPFALRQIIRFAPEPYKQQAWQALLNHPKVVLLDFAKLLDSNAPASYQELAWQKFIEMKPSPLNLQVAIDLEPPIKYADEIFKLILSFPENKLEGADLEAFARRKDDASPEVKEMFESAIKLRGMSAEELVKLMK